MNLCLYTYIYIYIHLCVFSSPLPCFLFSMFSFTVSLCLSTSLSLSGSDLATPCISGIFTGLMSHLQGKSRDTSEAQCLAFSLSPFITFSKANAKVLQANFAWLSLSGVCGRQFFWEKASKSRVIKLDEMVTEGSCQANTE